MCSPGCLRRKPGVVLFSCLFISTGPGAPDRAHYLICLFWVGPKSALNDYPIPYPLAEGVKLGMSLCKTLSSSPAFFELGSFGHKSSLRPGIFIQPCLIPKCPKTAVTSVGIFPVAFSVLKKPPLWLCKSDFQEYPI